MAQRRRYPEKVLLRKRAFDRGRVLLLKRMLIKRSVKLVIFRLFKSREVSKGVRIQRKEKQNTEINNKTKSGILEGIAYSVYA